MKKTSPWLMLGRFAFTIGLAATVVFIFSNSMLIAESSSAASGRVLRMVKELLHQWNRDEWAALLTDHIVRKAAHFCEYALEGFFTLLCLRVYTPHMLAHISWPLLGLLLTALTDETLQMFYEGRSGQLTDVWLDFSGGCAGILTAAILMLLVGALLRLLFGRRKTK